MQSGNRRSNTKNSDERRQKSNAKKVNQKVDNKKSIDSKSTKKKSDKKKEKQQKSPAEIKRTKTFKLMLNSVLGAFTIGISVGVLYNLTRYAELSDELNEINNSLSMEVQQQNNYEEQVRYLKSDEYIEKMAREQLGMVKPNEILYINSSS